MLFVFTKSSKIWREWEDSKPVLIILRYSCEILVWNLTSHAVICHGNGIVRRNPWVLYGESQQLEYMDTCNCSCLYLFVERLGLLTNSKFLDL